MKILLVNDCAVPVEGAELMTLALQNNLRRRGHDVRLFASVIHRNRPGPFVGAMANIIAG